MTTAKTTPTPSPRLSTAQGIDYASMDEDERVEFLTEAILQDNTVIDVEAPRVSRRTLPASSTASVRPPTGKTSSASTPCHLRFSWCEEPATR